MSIENIDAGGASSDTYGTLGQFFSDSWNGRSVTMEHTNNKDLTNRMILCGERCHGEASFDVSLDNDENKSVDAEVKVESEDGKISASVSGNMSQDKAGDTRAEVKFGGKIEF